MFTQFHAKDLARWILWDRIEEYNSAGNPLERGDLVVQVMRDLVGSGELARSKHHICARMLIVIANLVLEDNPKSRVMHNFI